MLDACRRAGVLLLIGHSRRFTRRYTEVKDALDSGAIGEVRLVRENERRNAVHIAQMGQTGIRWTSQHWTGNPDLGMGVALSHGIHEVDLLRWFIAAQPVSVYAEHAISIEGNVGVPDFMSFVVRFANGAIGSGEISYHPPASYPASHQLELFGTAGTIRARDHELISATEYDAEGAHFPGARELLLHARSTYVRQLAEIVAAIRENREVNMPPHEARRALVVALALIESARTGREVPLEPSAPSGVTA
jgi:predicted dehydrogenase